VAEKRSELFTISLNEEPHGSGSCSAEGRVFHSNFERRIEGLAGWFQRNAKADDLGGNDPKVVARMLFGMAFGLFHQWGDKARPQNLTDYEPILTEFFFHGVSSKPKTGARKK
jgi:hypothetical protein